MALYRLIIVIFFCLPLFASHDRGQLLYLLKSKKVEDAIRLYDVCFKKTGKHDFEILKEMAYLILQEEANTEDPQRQLLVLFGADSAGFVESPDIFEKALFSSEMTTQLVALQSLAKIHDERSTGLITSAALGSDFFPVRMEAAYHLVQRKPHEATALVTVLMQKTHFYFHPYFAEIFAALGTHEATSILKQMITTTNLALRNSIILAVASYERDDFLPIIRKCITHSDIAEKEVCAYALGRLNDSSSLPTLEKLSSHGFSNVRLAAAYAMTLLGSDSGKKVIEECALQKDLFAITLLSQLEGSEDSLALLVNDGDPHVRLNACLSLLARKDRRSLCMIDEILLRDERDLGVEPHSSIGGSLQTLKVVPSLQQHLGKEMAFNLRAFTLYTREAVLRACLDLPEDDFLLIAKKIFNYEQNDLVPVLVTLLENLNTEKAKMLLQKEAQKAGAPLIRAYCNLALLQMGVEGPYQERVIEWILQEKKNLLIRFRPVLSSVKRLKEKSRYQLTADEKTRLLIESVLTFTRRHDEIGVNLLLTLLREGNSRNRPALAGLLLQAMQ